jgi:hypothetical protein
MSFLSHIAERFSYCKIAFQHSPAQESASFLVRHHLRWGIRSREARTIAWSIRSREARTIAWSRRSREARTGVLLEEHLETIVRQMRVIIGKRTASLAPLF